MLLCSVLLGCTPERDAESMLENYLWRLSNVLELDVPASTLSTLTPLPRTRDRRLSVSAFEIGLLDFLSVQGCSLGELVGYRNSSLGRVMPDSQRLVYEIDFVDSVDRCVPRLDPQSDVELIHQLSTVRDRKYAEIGIHFWNAIFAGPEFGQLFSASAALPNPDQVDQTPAALAASQQLLALLSHSDPRAAPALALDRAQLESALAQLSAGGAGGQLRQRIAVLQDTLVRATLMLNQATDARAICPMQRPTERGRTLRNVFDLFFAGDIQPYAVPIFNHGVLLLDALTALRERGAVSPPPAMQGFWQQALGTDKSSEFGRFKRVWQGHIKAWQDALGACQLMPGQG